MNEYVYEHLGHCPICAAPRWFRATNTWYRDSLLCESCGSVPRERALALVLNDVMPDWRSKRIHECSPVMRGISLKMSLECPNYVSTQFVPAAPIGVSMDGFRNENLECTTFENESFDIIISLDVIEYVNDPIACVVDMYRTLSPGGVCIFTTPTHKERIVSERIARLLPDGSEEHYAPSDCFGNPIESKGDLVKFRYGYDFCVNITRYAPFDVQLRRYCDQTHGIIGEFTEVYECRKPLNKS